MVECVRQEGKLFMTEKENYDYYYNFLKSLTLSDDDIKRLFDEYPISKKPVKEYDRKEGLMIQLWGKYYFILYRTNNPETKDPCWLGINPNGTKKLIKTKYFKEANCYYPKTDSGPFCACINELKGLKISSSQSSQKRSIGEKIVGEILEEMFCKVEDICVEYEYPIEDLKGFRGVWKQTGVPRFDFAVIDKRNNKPLLFVEFDGQQHYKKGFKQSRRDYIDTTLTRDMIKNGYAFYSRIPLIRLPYGLLDDQPDPNLIKEDIKHSITEYLCAGDAVKSPY